MCLCLLGAGLEQQLEITTKLSTPSTFSTTDKGAASGSSDHNFTIVRQNYEDCLNAFCNPSRTRPAQCGRRIARPQRCIFGFKARAKAGPALRTLVRCDFYRIDSGYEWYRSAVKDRRSDNAYCIPQLQVALRNVKPAHQIGKPVVINIVSLGIA